MKIAVDFDDVLFSTGINFLQDYRRRYGVEIFPENYYSKEFFASNKLDQKEMISRILEYYQTKEARKLKPMAETKGVLSELRKEHELIVLSGRTESLEEATKRMIDENFPGIFSALFFTNIHRFNGGKNKGEFCRELGADLLIDDYIGFCQECAEVGIRSFLFTQPWNAKDKTGELITRVGSWGNIIEKINDF